MGPAVTPKLSELPVERDRRDAVLDSAHAEPTPEQRTPMKRTKKERQAETAAATAAAIIGTLLSDSSNVTIGVGSAIDEGHLTDPGPRRVPSEREATDDHEQRHARDRARQSDDGEPVDVPWIRLE